MKRALGLLETTGFTPAMVALDAIEKRATVQVLQAELNDFLGVCIKLLGPLSDLQEALAAGREVAERLGGQPVANIIENADDGAWTAIESSPEFNPLIQQSVVTYPSTSASTAPVSAAATRKDPNVSETPDALGFIETQGFTAVFEAVDAACKAANVEVVGKEKLGGGYVTVIIQGDVAAVRAAVDAGARRVEGLGKLIAAHVVTRPSPSVLGLLPRP